MMKNLVVQILFVASLLAGCGGGGGGGDLSVDFDYAGNALLWRSTSIPLIAQGLQGQTPSCTVISGSLPPGLKLASSGCLVSGVPERVGVSFPRIRLSVPGYQGQVDKEVRFEVFGPPVTYYFPLVGRRGVVISMPPAVWDTSPSARWTVATGEKVIYSVVSGALPGGLQLNSATGEVHGILTTVNVDEFSIAATVTGPRGTVTAVDIPYSINTIQEGLIFFYGPGDSEVGIYLGQSLNLPPIFSFGPYLDSSKYSFRRYRLNPSSPPLPAGLRLDPVTGRLSGKPVAYGSYELKFDVDVLSEGESAVYTSSPLKIWVAL